MRRIAALALTTLILFLLGTPAHATTINPTPTAFPQTNGPVLAGAMMYLPQQVLVIGGNFTQITEPNGRTVAARNLAAIDVATRTVIYAGDVNSYVRAIYATYGKLYVGGNFTAVNGAARPHIAQLDAYSRALTPWTPANIGDVNAIAVRNYVYYGSGTKVAAANRDTAAQAWTFPVTDGAVRALHISGDGERLYVGGLFEKIGTFAQHGIAMIYRPGSTAVVNTGFRMNLVPDSGPGMYDGEEPMSFVEDESGTLFIGVGGLHNGIYRVNVWDAGIHWYRPYEGDVQGIGLAGDKLIAGFHRSHGNTNGIPYLIFNAVTNKDTGDLVGTDLALTGDFPGNDAGGNGGIQAIVTTTTQVYVLGEFTVWGASCTWTAPGTKPGYVCPQPGQQGAGYGRAGIAVFNRT